MDVVHGTTAGCSRKAALDLERLLDAPALITPTLRLLFSFVNEMNTLASAHSITKRQ